MAFVRPGAATEMREKGGRIYIRISRFRDARAEALREYRNTGTSS